MHSKKEPLSLNALHLAVAVWEGLGVGGVVRMSGTGNARPYHICVAFMIMENRQQVGAGIARPCSVDEVKFFEIL